MTTNGTQTESNVPKKVQISILERQLLQVEEEAKRLKTALTVVYFEQELVRRPVRSGEDEEDVKRKALDAAMEKATRVERGE